jgi:hypothetical protein
MTIPPADKPATVFFPVPDGAGSVSLVIDFGDRTYNYGTPLKKGDQLGMSFSGDKFSLTLGPAGIGGGALPAQEWSGTQPATVSLEWG